MNLSDRLDSAREAANREADALQVAVTQEISPEPVVDLPAAGQPVPGVLGVEAVEPEAGAHRADRPRVTGIEHLAAERAAVAQRLVESLGVRLTDASISTEQLRELVHDEVRAIIEADLPELPADERRRLAREVENDAIGLGPLEAMLADDSISEIMVNRFDQVYVERGGRLSLAASRFASEAHLRRVIDRIVSRVGRRVDEASPYVDARLDDGSRVNAIVPPLAVDGSSLTIRKFARHPLTVPMLIESGSMTPQVATMLQLAVAARLNILVTGGTGTGKTTLLNVLSGFVPTGERIVTIEDAVELNLRQPHVVRLEARPPNTEGAGEVTIRDLVRNALRMRPDRIVIGECRSGEALDMLQAMNTGHEGSISTLHANSPRDALSRLETMVLMAGMDLPLRAVREQIASAIDLVVHVSRMRDGSRRVTHVSEVLGYESDALTLQDIFEFDYAAGIAADGRILGAIHATGVRPRCVEKIHALGLAIDPGLFVAPPSVASGSRG